MVTPQINLLAIFVAAVVGMIISMIWYAPSVFGKKWMVFLNIQPDQMEAERDRQGRTFILAFLNTMIIAYVLEFMLVAINAQTYNDAFWIAVLAWAGFIATVLFGRVLWENKPLGLFNINAGYYLFVLIVMAIILQSM
ncbi:DUF1761 domain-containing protein [Omnitrophica bacterium]|nr:DUF1761 domain-containing protein [Candidatus Omnitrophota bacterium]